MIRFFRQLRKGLFNEKPSPGKDQEVSINELRANIARYLFYAIGEIILVVIGILIALSINNWNEARKEASKEVKVLKSLELDLSENLQRLEQMITSESLLVQRNKVLIELLKKEQTSYHDSLRIYFGNIATYFAFFPQVTAYESLKSEGVSLIKNDSLRFSLIKLFDDHYERNAHTTELKKDNALNSQAFLNKHFEIITLDNGWQGGVPNDFELVKGNRELINTISHHKSLKSNFLSFSKNIYENTRTTRELITDELAKLEGK